MIGACGFTEGEVGVNLGEPAAVQRQFEASYAYPLKSEGRLSSQWRWRTRETGALGRR